MQAAQQACTSRAELSCVLLDVSVRTDEAVPSGRLVMRLSPAAVPQMIGIASEGGKITSRTTHAEDLAEPVADTERELSQLSVHRDRLMELMKSKSITIDQLITVSKELASVQSRMDELSSRKANLSRRIDTELLTINMSMPVQAVAAEEHPIGDAFAAFGSEFKAAVANVIRFIAVVAPWLVVVLPGLVLLRLFWRTLGRRLARGETK
jgi:hypothetical protein